MNARSLHPFPAKMAPEIATAWLSPLDPGRRLTVLDPMCGSGTALVAALDAGHDCIGTDLDPLAVLLSRVATEPVDLSNLTKAAERVLACARRSRRRTVPWFDEETTEFAEYWFGNAQRSALIRLAVAIAGEPEGPTQRALYVALSRLIITKTPRASLASDTSHSRPHRTVLVSDYDVLTGFERSVRQVRARLATRPAERTRGHAVVTLGDARTLHGLDDGQVDAVITSPPYLNAIDYMRGHRLSLIWMGYTLAHLRKIRATSIGTERTADKANPETWDLIEAMRSHAASGETFPTGMLHRFATDMLQLGTSLARVTKPGAKAVLVVGNSTLKGNYIENDRITAHGLERAGFKLMSRTEREIPESSRYLPFARTASKTLAARMRSEVILAFEKPAVGE